MADKKETSEKGKGEGRSVRRNGIATQGAETGGALGTRVVYGGDVVTEAEVGPENFKKLLDNPGFTVVKVLLVALALGLVAALTPAPAMADAGTNFTYPAKIGWGGSRLDQLPTIFDAVDTLFTGVRGELHSPVADITALKAIAATGATARADKQLCYVESASGAAKVLYAFDSGSSEAGDDDNIVQPTSGTGRWYRLGGSATAVTMTTAAAGSGYVVTTGGADRTVVDSTVSLTNIPTMAAAGGAGELLYTAAGNKAIAKSGITAANTALLTSLIAVTPSASGASLVGIEDAAPGYFTGTTVETALHEAGASIATMAVKTVPLAPHSIATLAGTTGVLEDSGFMITEVPHIIRTRISAPIDALPHDTTYTIPANSMILDAWAVVITEDAVPGALTINLGVNGNVNGLFNNIPISSPAAPFTCKATLDAGLAYYASTLCGTLLSSFAAGSSAAERGLFQRFPDATSGGKALAYQASGAADTLVLDLYVVIAVGQ